jgi:hypothetical protein
LSFLLHSRSTFQRNFFVGDIYSINWISRCAATAANIKNFVFRFQSCQLAVYGKGVREKPTASDDCKEVKYCTEPLSFVVWYEEAWYSWCMSVVENRKFDSKSAAFNTEPYIKIFRWSVKIHLNLWWSFSPAKSKKQTRWNGI